MKRNGTVVVAILIALSMLGGHFSHAHARDCAHTAPAVSHSLHAHYNSSAEAETADRLDRSILGGISCDGGFCPTIGCCFPRITAGLMTPRTASSAMPLLLAMDASGTGPADVEHPPQHR